mmetsp:Transcript_12991/g.36531  ORF Transcript_12991/g.36531 Transcript_12991/m.36531 type:complete len:215 (+) Transcript_12991:1766-2410(+)
MAPRFCRAAKRSFTSMGCAFSRRRLCSTSSVARTCRGASTNLVFPSRGVHVCAFSASMTALRSLFSDLSVVSDSISALICLRLLSSCLCFLSCRRCSRSRSASLTDFSLLRLVLVFFSCRVAPVPASSPSSAPSSRPSGSSSSSSTSSCSSSSSCNASSGSTCCRGAFGSRSFLISLYTSAATASAMESCKGGEGGLHGGKMSGPWGRRCLPSL